MLGDSSCRGDLNGYPDIGRSPPTNTCITINNLTSPQSTRENVAPPHCPAQQHRLTSDVPMSGSRGPSETSKVFITTHSHSSLVEIPIRSDRADSGSLVCPTHRSTTTSIKNSNVRHQKPTI
ncbi:hypothetical protein B0O80DRAFT_530369 [Mortierella sp. GBAus27b]|nr:hypothetical protein B0O80DRAFT_530369 [Mortierella sp. GBAus27b]